MSAMLAVVFSQVSEGEPGTRYNLSPNSLPAPRTTLPNEIDPRNETAPRGFLPKVPPGFAVSVFVSAPQLRVRWLRVAPNGDVFLADRDSGRITVLRDADGNGKAERVATFATGFSDPHGMAFHAGGLYVADVRAIWRLPYADGDLAASAPPTRLTQAPNLRPVGWHLTREIALDSKGRLLLAIGARADVEEGDPTPDATIQEVTPAGALEPFATGIRNAVGLAFYPGTDDLWATVNERDFLGAALPPDYLTRVNKGDFFGWPYAYVGPHPDPDFGARNPGLVAKTKTPDVLFEAHSAPLGLAFYDGRQFPADYVGDAFVAFHGSGPFDKPTGYKVVRVKFTNGRPAGGYEDFVTGFLADASHTQRKPSGVLSPVVWGMPAGLAVAKDGSLLIGDEQNRAVWRVAYTGQ
jgi:glucose/arabinose dehydrogenase